MSDEDNHVSVIVKMHVCLDYTLLYLDSLDVSFTRGRESTYTVINEVNSNEIEPNRRLERLSESKFPFQSFQRQLSRYYVIV